MAFMAPTGIFAADSLKVSATPPTMGVFRGNFKLLQWSNTAMNQLYGQIEMGDAYRDGWVLIPVLRWTHNSATDAGNVKWSLEYCWANNELEELGNGVITSKVVPALASSRYKTTRTVFSEISGSGKKKESSILFRLFRNPVDVEDTIAAAATPGIFIVSFRFEYQKG